MKLYLLLIAVLVAGCDDGRALYVWSPLVTATPTPTGYIVELTSSEPVGSPEKSANNDAYRQEVALFKVREECPSGKVVSEEKEATGQIVGINPQQVVKFLVTIEC
ncbi:MAG: hypothetical protein ABJN26_25445 [Stappiaceae bacterium]